MFHTLAHNGKLRRNRSLALPVFEDEEEKKKKGTNFPCRCVVLDTEAGRKSGEDRVLILVNFNSSFRKPMQEPIEDFLSPGDIEFVECSREKLVPYPRAYVVYGFCLEVLNSKCFDEKLGHFCWCTRRNLTPIARNTRVKFPRVKHH
ncbi:hypothetical protein NL676_027877 [Syzygium grande]|nr:hypothetical protein NL676_027877 [Syzygium grande]